MREGGGAKNEVESSGSKLFQIGLLPFKANSRAFCDQEPSKNWMVSSFCWAIVVFCLWGSDIFQFSWFNIVNGHQPEDRYSQYSGSIL